MTDLPAYEFRPVQPGDDFDNELIGDLIAAGFQPVTLEPVYETSPADRDYFIVRDFLEFCLRLTGERFAVNPSIAAHFQSLRIPASLYETKELPYDGTLNLSFNG